MPRSHLPLPGLLALVSVQGAATHDWPCWRGPAHDGVSRETEWSSTGRAAPLWRAEVGLGYSSVVIAGGRLYTLGHERESAAGTPQDRVLCLDARTGERLWVQAYDEPTLDTYHGGGSNSTPTVAQGVVYSAGRNGRCLALDALSGERLWEHDYQSELELPPAQYGYAGSPLVEGTNLWLALGANVLCVDARDGSLRWRRTLSKGEGYATPTPFQLDGRAVLGALGSDALVVLEAATGAERARFPWKGEQGSLNAGSPIVVPGPGGEGVDVFLSSAFGAGAARLRLAPEPELVWRSRRMRNKVAGCTLLDGHVYGFDESMLKCIDFEDGSECWSVRGLGMGSLAVAGDRLLVLSSRGELIVARATPEGFQELSRRAVLEDGVYWTVPVLLDGLIYCRNSLGSLVCLDHRSAAQQAAAAPEASGVSGAETPDAARLFRTHAERIGAARLAQRRSLHLAGTYRCTGAGVPDTPATMDTSGADRWRLEWDLGEDGRAQRVLDGTRGWQADPYYGTFLFAPDTLRELSETRCLFAPSRWTELGELATPARCSFDGRDCWRVDLNRGDGSGRSYYFEAQGGLLAGHESPGEALTVYGDYRDFEGVKLATHITWLMPDTGAEEQFRVERASWDGVPDGLFAPPPAVASLLRTPEEKAADAERLRAAHGRLFGRYEGDPPQVGEAPRVGQVGVEDGKLVLRLGERVLELGTPDAEGRFPVVEMGPARCTFELDARGDGRLLRLEGLPGREPLVLRRAQPPSGG